MSRGRKLACWEYCSGGPRTGSENVLGGVLGEKSFVLTTEVNDEPLTTDRGADMEAARDGLVGYSRALSERGLRFGSGWEAGSRKTS